MTSQVAADRFAPVNIRVMPAVQTVPASEFHEGFVALYDALDEVRDAIKMQGPQPMSAWLPQPAPSDNKLPPTKITEKYDFKDIDSLEYDACRDETKLLIDAAHATWQDISFPQLHINVHNMLSNRTGFGVNAAAHNYDVFCYGHKIEMIHQKGLLREMLKCMYALYNVNERPRAVELGNGPFSTDLTPVGERAGIPYSKFKKDWKGHNIGLNDKGHLCDLGNPDVTEIVEVVSSKVEKALKKNRKGTKAGMAVRTKKDEVTEETSEVVPTTTDMNTTFAADDGAFRTELPHAAGMADALSALPLSSNAAPSNAVDAWRQAQPQLVGK